ncbi:MAG: hypothetical protein SGJ02_01030 [bacterium]|nr:hypothetical protein [bacterium]
MLLETRNALNSLSDAIELTKMVEELMTPGREAQLVNILPGIRLTLRNSREVMTQSHSTISKDFVAVARTKLEEMKQQKAAASTSNGLSAAKATPANINNVALGLNTSIEKIVQP